MEFGFLTQGYLPDHVSNGDPNAEHQVLMDDFDLCVAAEAAGFKYVWISEHHFLHEYSHISASDVFLGALATATSKIHLGAGIFNPLPKVHHPAAVAERVAMLDHLTEGRFEFGTGRGAGSHEVTGFHDELPDSSGTTAIWDEVIPEFVKMFTQHTYEGFQGKYWSMPPREILPKPYGPLHPAMWYAAGSPASFTKAARMGLGVLGFSLDELERTEIALRAYKREIVNAEPVGAYVNDNLLVANGINFIHEDREVARQQFLDGGIGYHFSQVFKYHDTFPRPDGFPVWPDVMPDPDEAVLDHMIDIGAAIVGNPDDAVEQIKRWESTGADQFLLLRGTKTKEQTLETNRLLGEYVIPKFDTDPVHRTTRLRQQAAGVAIPA